MHDVAIVGYGPTGATLACLLGQSGIDTIVVDRAESIYDKPRAIALDHEILRVFQGLGVMPDVIGHVAAYPPSEYRGVDGRVIKRLDAVPPPWPQGWEPNVSFTQPPVEAALRARVDRIPSVKVRLGEEVTAVTQLPSAVDLSLKGPTGTSSIQARYVVACDGATSFVRRSLGIGFQDRDFDEPWLVVDVKVHPSELHLLPRVNVQYCEPDRPCTYVVGPGNHRRWEIMLKSDEDLVETAKEAQVWKLLARWIKPEQATLWRSATYRFHALVAERWRDRRIFLAGDAAHQQPPFLGQGMCQGVRDAVNLSWKLELVLQGKARDELLNSYEQERLPHAIELIDTIKTLGRFICERDPIKALERDERLIEEMGGETKTTLRQDLIPPLKHGLISAIACNMNGRLFPQPRAVNGLGGLLDEVDGGGFRLLVAGDVPDGEWLTVVRQYGMELKVIRVGTFAACLSVGKTTVDLNFYERDGLVEAWFEANKSKAVVLRPDHYVFGIAKEEKQIEELVHELALRLQLSSEPARQMN